ncbi:unnamed protein product [Brachionus calyciflorus]|uniref:Uncharacterized protein n=1 Tax=Brachionus calyciflorus TaxID=104777 RepID=A0A813SL82_9BILA|nr:unnamed protein product [Brachionus calyciflorus]
MKFFSKIILLCTLAVLSSFKISFDNGNSMLRLESNKLRNGKPVSEPKAEEAIETMNQLGFKVVDISDEKPEDKSEAVSVLKAKGSREPTSSIDIKPRDSIDAIFNKILSSSDKTRNLNHKKYPTNDPRISHQKIQLDHAKYGSFDIYITNVNENVNNNTEPSIY